MEPITSRTKFVFFNYAFWPDHRATAVLLRTLLPRLAKSLDVEVVCGMSGPDALKDNGPAVPIRRFPSPLEGSKRTLFRLLDYLWVLAAFCVHLLRRPEPFVAVLCSEPPLMDTVLAALCRFRGIRYSVIIHDLYPDFARNSGTLVNDATYRWLRQQSRIAFAKAAGVVAVSEDTRRYLAADGITTDVIPNWADVNLFSAVPPLQWTHGPIVVQYAGHIGHACDLEAFAEALRRLNNPDDFQFEFYCFGLKMKRLKEIIREHPQVRFCGWRSYESLPAVFMPSHAQLVLTPTHQYGAVYASKFHLALAAGRPLLASLPPQSEMHRTIADLGVGISVRSDETGSLAAALDQFRRQLRESPARVRTMGERGREFTQKEWNADAAAQAYRQWLLLGHTKVVAGEATLPVKSAIGKG